MEISLATRTHLFYQFIIMILLFFGNGYEILLDRKILLFLASVPIVCYQLIVLACCMELIPIPSWMSFLQLTSEDSNTESILEKDYELCSSPVENGKILNSHGTEMVFPEVCEIFPPIRRWEKSVMNLGATPKCYVRPQKSKSWMNLSDSRSSERMSSQEGSLDTIASSTDSQVSSQCQTRSGKTSRKDRAEKAKSWKTCLSDFKNCRKPELEKCYSLKDDGELTQYGKKNEQEEPELEKSYSFPFRQKRLQSWLEMKESTSPPNQRPDVPYWQSVGYNLAVKYEARRRQRPLLNSIKNTINEDSNLVKSTENVPESVSTEKPNPKKSSKSAAARINKLKVGISNLVLKKKEEIEDSNNSNNKVNKSALFKLKNKTSSQITEGEPIAMPEFPLFLNNDRPLIFYPKYLPFEKERFESDVKKKMAELAEEQKNKQQFLC